MNHSIKLSTPCEIINLTPINPLISKCQIKVCYVGDTPNRNKSIITKEVARQLANSLPGSPIVGYYREDKEDFDEHSRELEIKNGSLYFKDITRPYGFVDLNAKAWFQKYSDNGVEREYLVTEGWLWTGQYPECRRILERGNNQSMELDEKIIDAFWTKDDNGKREFFIINEAIISKLCILGEDVEPCFEGAQITKVEYSLNNDFKEELFSMIKEIKNILEEGGTPTMEDNVVLVEEPVVEEAVVEETIVEEPIVEEEVSTEEPVAEVEEEPIAEEPIVEEEPAIEEPVNNEYNELCEKYAALETQYNEVCAVRDALQAENASLIEFKANIERLEKKAMIDKFYMLSEDDKADVIANIDTYSLDDIEAKLSILCVRNKVSFDLDNDKEPTQITYHLESTSNHKVEEVPEFVKTLRRVAKSM